MIADSLPFGPGAYAFIGLYLLSLIGIGWLGRRARKDNSLKDFYLGGSGVGFIVLLLTLYATQYSGNTLFAFTSKGFSQGYLWLTSVQFMTAILIGFLIYAPKLYRLARKHSFVTPTDYIDRRFKLPALNILAALIMVVSLGNYFLAQLTAMGRAIQGLTAAEGAAANNAFIWGVVVLAGIMIVYESLGGFRAVAWTDVIQGTVLAIGFAILLVMIFVKYGAPSITTQQLLATSPEKVLPPTGPDLFKWISYIVIFGLGASLYPHAVQRIYAAKSGKVLRRSMAVMSFMPLITTLVALLVGVTAAVYILDIPDGAATETVLTRVMLDIQSGGWFGYCLVVVVFAAILGAILSTADSALLSVSSMLTKDIYARFINPKATESSLTKLGKIISWVLVISLAALAIYLNSLGGKKPTLIQIMDLKFDMLVQLAPAFMIGINWKGLRAWPTLLGMAAGLSIALLMFILPKIDEVEFKWISEIYELGVHRGLYGLALNVFIAVGGSLLLGYRKKAA
ncbi:MAG: SSS family solute:Na+ symporter [Verrucomicrobiales bacterium]|jgi:SSS family solute:Na+ symporter